MIAYWVVFYFRLTSHHEVYKTTNQAEERKYKRKGETGENYIKQRKQQQFLKP